MEIGQWCFELKVYRGSWCVDVNLECQTTRLLTLKPKVAYTDFIYRI